MKKILTVALVVSLQITYGQNRIDFKQDPYIEVTGYAEKKVIPDEIHLSITIKERVSGRDKISVKQQERDLKLALKKLSISLENLEVSDAQADYVRVKWTKKDVISQSRYEIKLSTAQQVADVFVKLDELKIHNAFISQVSHSKIKDYRKEVEIEAIKKAKLKAKYLLAAIGHELGVALVINQRNLNFGNYSIDEIRTQGAKVSSRALDESSGQDIVLGVIEFKKIKLEATVYTKFEIK